VHFGKSKRNLISLKNYFFDKNSGFFERNTRPKPLKPELKPAIKKFLHVQILSGIDLPI
jgi:hypothetical protein